MTYYFTIQNDWSVGLSLRTQKLEGKLNLFGSQSNFAKFARAESKWAATEFQLLSIDCELYEYSIATSKAKLSEEFQSAVSQLPLNYITNKDRSAYQHFINQYGTHYTSHVTLGGRIETVSSVQTCVLSLLGMTLQQTSECEGVRAGLYAGPKLTRPGGVSGGLSSCDSTSSGAVSGGVFKRAVRDSRTHVIGGDLEDLSEVLLAPHHEDKVERWMKSLKAQPEVVGRSLVPLWEALHHATPDIQLEARIPALQQAIEEYIQVQATEAAEDQCALPCHPSYTNAPCTCPVSDYADNECCPHKTGYGTVIISNMMAEGLDGFDTLSAADAYVKTELVAPKKITIVQSSNSPEWPSVIWKFPDQQLGKQFKLKLMDSDDFMNGGDDVLCECDVKLEATRSVNKTCMGLKKATFHYTMQILCPPYLTGPMCNQLDHKQMTSPQSMCPSQLLTFLSLPTHP